MPANGSLPLPSSRCRAASLARGKSFSSTAGDLFFSLVNGEPSVPEADRVVNELAVAVAGKIGEPDES
jgi:hypothetical protein